MTDEEEKALDTKVLEAKLHVSATARLWGSVYDRLWYDWYLRRRVRPDDPADPLPQRYLPGCLAYGRTMPEGPDKETLGDYLRAYDAYHLAIRERWPNHPDLHPYTPIAPCLTPPTTLSRNLDTPCSPSRGTSPSLG